MRQVIKVGLKRGPNTYSGKRGAPRSIVEIRTGPVVIMEVDPNVIAPDCIFTVSTFNEKVNEIVTGDRVGHINDLFIYSPCFSQEYLAKTKRLNK